MLLEAHTEHPSRCEELAALGVRLVGAMLRRVRDPKAFAPALTKSAVSGARFSNFLTSSLSTSSRGSVPIASMTTSLQTAREGRSSTLQSPLRSTSTASTSSGSSSRSRTVSLWEQDEELDGAIPLCEVDEVGAIGDALGRVVGVEMLEDHVAKAWGISGGARILYRAVARAIEGIEPRVILRPITEGSAGDASRNAAEVLEAIGKVDSSEGLGEDLYGALLELALLTDLLVASITADYACATKSTMTMRVRSQISASSEDHAFLLTEYPQLESSLFIPPPSRVLAPLITDSVPMPRLSNPYALGALLRILPSLPAAQQERAWQDLDKLVGTSSNLSVLVTGHYEVIANCWLTALFKFLRGACKCSTDVAVGSGALGSARDPPSPFQSLESSEEARKDALFPRASHLYGDMLAWSLWVGSTKPGRSSLQVTTALALNGSLDDSHREGRDEGDSDGLSILRSVLSMCLGNLKRRASFATSSVEDGGGAEWSLAEIRERRPRWEALLELLFVTAATTVQQTCASALPTRSTAQAVAVLVHPSRRRIGGPKTGLLALGRQETQGEADCLVALQVLELFDSLLWPSSTHHALDEVTSSSRLPAGPPGRFPHQPPMLMTLIQLCLVTLAFIHPSDPAAAVNAGRLKRLVQWLLQQPVRICFSPAVCNVLSCSHCPNRRAQPFFFCRNFRRRVVLRSHGVARVARW